ncbi:MAG TPA: hypothetical protein DCE55_26065, partial [Planctomycetaceae bacterium]|nr:hypothetical protein [Planctomycetaceae bacterium]
MNETVEFLKHVVTRRQLLRRGSAGIGSLALHSMLAPDAFAERARAWGPHYAPQARRIIFLFMNGAPSQQDLFDYKPVVDKYHGEELFKRYDEKTGKWSDRGFVKKTQRLTGMTAGQSSFPISRSKFRFRQHGESRAWVSEVLP